MCKISKIEESDFLPKDHFNYLMIGVVENPNSLYNWNYILEQQEELKKSFGNERGHPDPDYRPEFNNSDADWH